MWLYDLYLVSITLTWGVTFHNTEQSVGLGLFWFKQLITELMYISLSYMAPGSHLNFPPSYKQIYTRPCYNSEHWASHPTTAILPTSHLDLIRNEILCTPSAEQVICHHVDSFTILETPKSLIQQSHTLSLLQLAHPAAWAEDELCKPQRGGRSPVQVSEWEVFHS